MPKQPAVHTVVIVLDDPEKTASIRQVLVSHESIDVHAAYENDTGDHQLFHPIVSKELIASKLGKKQEAAEEMLSSLAARFQQSAGDIVLTREEVQALLDKAGETNIIQPIIDDIDLSVVPEGFEYEPETATPGEGEITFAAFDEAASVGNEGQSGKPSVNLLVTEEDAA